MSAELFLITGKNIVHIIAIQLIVLIYRAYGITNILWVSYGSSIERQNRGIDIVTVVIIAIMAGYIPARKRLNGDIAAYAA